MLKDDTSIKILLAVRTQMVNHISPMNYFVD